MYDPHRLRRNDRRYFSRKGQIIQAKAINPPFTIESNKIEAYKEYILQNNLIPRPPTPSPFPIPITSIKAEGQTIMTFPLADFTYYAQPITLTGDAGPKIVISATLENGVYKFKVSYRTQTSFTFPGQCWVDISAITASSTYNIQFYSNETMLFNTEIFSADNPTESYIQIPQSEFELELPAPSG